MFKTYQESDAEWHSCTLLHVNGSKQLGLHFIAGYEVAVDLPLLRTALRKP